MIEKLIALLRIIYTQMKNQNYRRQTKKKGRGQNFPTKQQREEWKSKKSDENNNEKRRNDGIFESGEHYRRRYHKQLPQNLHTRPRQQPCQPDGYYVIWIRVEH